MGSPFVWFDLRTPQGDAARRFYAGLLDWEIDGNGALASGGAPWGVVAEDDGLDAAHWLPYVQVDDVDVAAAKALELGATIMQEKTAGPAGHFTVIADPLGAPVALWQPT